MTWFGKKANNGDNAKSDNSESTQRVVVTDNARAKLTELIQNAAAPVLGVRILAEATSPVNPEYSLAFVQEGEDFEDDTVLDFDDFKIFIDADSLEFVENVQLDFVQQGMGGGFRIDKVVKPGELSGDIAERLQQIIDQQINPALALHGGFVKLTGVEGSTAYIELGGGCRGCGMVDVTLKQGIEVMIKQSVPEITQVLDQTDHASGRNPFYKPSK
jgi:Fe/S biogenesis protein NfuA